eukprot:2640019-Pyramimonas_sp.AAC.1
MDPASTRRLSIDRTRSNRTAIVARTIRRPADSLTYARRSRSGRVRERIEYQHVGYTSIV